LCLKFNGWGERKIGKYDDEVSGFIARATGLRLKQPSFCMEGGAIDFDGEGRALVSHDCLLDPKRNPEMTPKQIGDFLQETFGLSQIIWLGGSILNDPTGGHINNIARFVGPGRVVCQMAATSDDPNTELYEQTAHLLEESGLDVIRLPSPGRILGLSCDIAPASHMNFVIGNQSIIMPCYEETYAKEAAAILQRLFPERTVLTFPASHLLAGGQSFHGMTRAEPAF
jgi:agmatine deiminase